MKMKLPLYVLLVLAVMLVAPFALADNQTNTIIDDDAAENYTETEYDDSSVDEEVGEAVDEEEVATELGLMMTQSGAEVRLLQLAKSIERNILQGEEVLAAHNFSSEQLVALNGQLDILRGLLEDVNAVDLQDRSDELAAEFVAIKKEALIASKDFRDLARTVVGETTADQIRERVQEKVAKRVTAMKTQIAEKRNQHNAAQVAKLYQRMGISDDAMIQQIQSGDVSWNEVKEQIRTRAIELTQEQKRKVVQEVKEDRIKQRVFERSIRLDTDEIETELEVEDDEAEDNEQDENETESEDVDLADDVRGRK
ncbi:RNA polymerase I-specific transcription initiation factor RRN3 family protein [Candidatus Woesearchaeota archaeon]|nr:RNA polymerase I-specific transcription initiation factor RRN3 family protein [Candidatus Woesearchaeota archaeon]